MSKLSVGLVGCGRWGRHILRDLLSLGCEVSVVETTDEARACAREGGASRIFGNTFELPPVAGLVVATPTVTHAAVIESLLDRRVPIFTEKPLSADRESAERLARLAPDHLFVMDKWRYHPGVELLREVARSRELGPVQGLRITRAQWGNPHTDVDTVWILAPHDLAIALEVLGEIPKSRCAVAEQEGGRATSLIGILGDDPWVVLEVSSRRPEHRREVRLHCRDGVAELDDAYSQHLRLTRNESRLAGQTPESELREIHGELPLLRELRAFTEHLLGGPPPRSSAAEGAQIVSTIADLRALAGLREGQA